MVAAHEGAGLAQVFEAHQGGLSADRVFAQQAQFVAAHVGHRFGEQFVGQADLADVVEQGGEHHVLHVAGGEAQFDGDLAGQVGNAPRMAGAGAFAQFDKIGEDADRGQEVLLEFLVGRLEFAGARLDLVFEAGVEALQFFVLAQRQGFQAGFFA